MPEFLFIFGYETPEQAKRNNLFSFDDEDSNGLLIVAETEVEALAWGNKIAEHFLEMLYRDSGVSWKEHGYIGWIKHNLNPETDYWKDQQRITVGELPDFTQWMMRGNEVPNPTPKDTHRQNIRISLGGAIGVAVAFLLLVILEKTHHEADRFTAEDNARVGKVMMSVVIAAFMSVVSLISAIQPLMRGNLRPIFWLACVVVIWIVFGNVYDFRGLMRR